MPAPSYRFHCSIVDETTGETVISDFTFLTTIGEFGHCDSVDIHIGALLRAFECRARAEYEQEHYGGEQQPAEPFSVTVERVRNAMAAE